LAVSAFDRSCEPEICDLEVEVTVVKDVLRLEVSVSNPSLVHVVESIHKLLEVEPSDRPVISSALSHIVEELTSLG
jgi:hypothetical protein